MVSEIVHAVTQLPCHPLGLFDRHLNILFLWAISGPHLFRVFTERKVTDST